MNKESFQRYADLKNQIKQLTEETKAIESDILNQMKTQEVEQVASDFGTFSITRRKTWSYSNKVEEIKNQLEEQKTKEETEGVATSEEKIGLMFRSINN